MNLVKYFTAFSLFSFVGFTYPANAITFEFDKTTGDGNARAFGTMELDNLNNDGVLKSEINSWDITIEEVGNTSNSFNLTPSNSDLNYGDNEGFLQTSGDTTEFILDASAGGEVDSINFIGDQGNNAYQYGEFNGNDGDADPEITISDSSFGGDTNSPDNVIATSEPVPFEAEGTMGLVALGGFFGYRYYKKRKQALNQ